MLDLKNQKMVLEADLAKKYQVATEMQDLLQHYHGEVEQATALCEKMCEDLRNHMTMIGTEEADYEVMITMKQGQVEIPQAAVVTDYGDALLLNKNVIENRNSRIMQLNGE